MSTRSPFVQDLEFVCCHEAGHLVVADELRLTPLGVTITVGETTVNGVDAWTYLGITATPHGPGDMPLSAAADFVALAAAGHAANAIAPRG